MNNKTIEDVLDYFFKKAQATQLPAYALKAQAEEQLKELVMGALPERRETIVGRTTAFNDGFNSGINNSCTNLDQLFSKERK